MCSGAGNGTITTELRASLILNQRPSRCSWPTAAATNLPLGASARPLTKPVRGVESSGVSLRSVSSQCQKRRWPSHEPETTTSEYAGAASAVSQHGPPHGARPCASFCVTSGRLRFADQNVSEPS
eukprot:jgi/Chrpa1/25031/Chrysochromulina_OHIO_Genome00007506-RA